MVAPSSQQIEEVFPRPISERMHIELSPGPHPKLVRDNGGRLAVIVRLPNGDTERRAVYVFEDSVIA